MAYKIFDNYSESYEGNTSGAENKIILESGSGKRVDLPDSSYVTDADMSRDGIDLVLETPEGTVVVEGYFATDPTPHLVAPDGTTLTPNLVESFLQGGNEYANTDHSANDASPIGAVQEIAGEATVTRLDGSVETVGIGTPIYQGDVIETDEEGAVNIMFVDETSFAVSEDARLAIDEYVFDPATQSGTTNFSVLKGVFVFTSGLIGREDPDDVLIETPSGSIGIRGTIIAGDVDTGEITVIEGAIVLYDFSGNTLTLSNQYETAKFNPSDNTIDLMGELAANDVASKFMSVSTVAADLFSTIEDSAAETPQDNSPEPQKSDDNNPEKDANASDGEGEVQTAGAEGEVIMSEDIIAVDLADPNGDDIILSDVTNDDNLTDLEPSSGDDEVYEVIIEEQAPKGFCITVEKLAFTENVNGQDVARVTGQFTNMTNMALLGPSVNYYDIVREDENTFLISLKPGVSIDAEDPFQLFVGATNENGAASVAEVIDLNVINVNEPITYEALAPNVTGVDNFFSGSQDTVFSYDMSQEFDDPEGQNLTYSFVGGPPVHADILSVNLDANGQLDITLDGAVTVDDNFTFTVRADTGSGFLDQTFTFDIIGMTTTSSFIGTNNAVYTGNDAVITVAANNVSIFSDIDASDNMVLLSGNNAYIKTGDGDDIITINVGSNNYHAYGDLGEDTFLISDIQGKSYGGDGDDLFTIATTGAQSQLEALGAGVAIEGGSGNDVLRFGILTGGTIDFDNVTVGFIENIEGLSFDNGTTHTIDLAYNNVINMTDDRNILVIDTDGNDTVNFNNTSPNVFTQAQNTVNLDGEFYNVFTDGTITLMVDVEAASVNGII